MTVIAVVLTLVSDGTVGPTVKVKAESLAGALNQQIYNFKNHDY